MIYEIDLALINGESVPERLLEEYKKVREVESTKPVTSRWRSTWPEGPTSLDERLNEITYEEWRTKSVNDIADEIPCSVATVRNFRREKFGAYSPRVYRLKHRSTLDDIRRQWDWTKTDTQLAGMKGLSRERIRQMRVRLGMPPSPDTHKSINGLKLLDKGKAFVKTLEQPVTLTIEQASKMAGVPRDVIKRAGAEFGIEFIRANNHSIELDHANFELPNHVLAEIWGRSCFQIASLRCRYNKGDAKWYKHKGKLLCKPGVTGSTMPQFELAVMDERDKRDKYKPKHEIKEQTITREDGYPECNRCKDTK